jgi:hypothetical protein
MLFIQCEGLGLLNVRHVGDTALRPGDRVGLHFDESRLHFFDPSGRALRG